ncbi:hypothetical protein CVIRNUC_010088 [Coccomyxa viridis]|uniref:VTT domain-containing protein n=1 Tax=Coccomyxa viridis TaxID=1274662 RepID=A0AAV1ILP6_9CHLO|nr:hypothetical protein CVIRNUC_010088 [Coccomyxa viridis]
MLQTSLRQRSSAIVTSLAPFHGRPIASISLQISAPCKQRCPIRHFSAFKVRQKPIFSSRASLSASPALTVEVATRKPDPHPRSLLRLAVLLGVGFLAVSLLSPAAAWAKGAAASTPSYSFPAAARGLTDFLLHLDKHLSAIIAEHGKATYAILFAIVFAETGFVLTPFLPGDSLLFAAGAFAALGTLNVWALLGIFITAAILGDALNYAIGNYAGAKAIESGLVRQDFIRKTEDFYRKHGGKTVILARFVPIVRTFAPFVAGVGSMPYAEFGAYNVGGALLWTFMFVGAGFFLGNLPAVKHNFTLVVLGIVVVSVMPILFEIVVARRGAGKTGTNADGLPKGPARWRPG